MAKFLIAPFLGEPDINSISIIIAFAINLATFKTLTNV